MLSPPVLSPASVSDPTSRIRQPYQVLDQCRVVRTLLVGLVDIADDRRDRFRGCPQRVDAGLLEADLVIIDPSNESIQRARDRHAPLDVGHVGAAVQGMAGTIQLVGDFKRRRLAVAGLQVVDDDLEMPGGFFCEYIE